MRENNNKTNRGNNNKTMPPGPANNNNKIETEAPRAGTAHMTMGTHRIPVEDHIPVRLIGIITVPGITLQEPPPSTRPVRQLPPIRPDIRRTDFFP